MKIAISLFSFLLTLIFAGTTLAVTTEGEKATGETGALGPKTGEAQQEPGGGPKIGEALISESETGEQSLVSVNHLLGKNIKNQQGEELGEIQNILVDPETGQIAYVTVGTGEVFTSDVKVVPFQALEVSQEEISMDIDKEKLANAPSFGEGQSIQEFDRQSSEFFGVGSHWTEEEVEGLKESETKEVK